MCVNRDHEPERGHLGRFDRASEGAVEVAGQRCVLSTAKAGGPPTRRFMESHLFLFELLSGHEPARVGRCSVATTRSVAVVSYGALECPVERLVPEADYCAVWRAFAFEQVFPVGKVCSFKSAFGRGSPAAAKL